MPVLTLACCALANAVGMRVAQLRGGITMTACNVVRFRVKPGREAEFTEAQRGPPRSLPDASALH